MNVKILNILLLVLLCACTNTRNETHDNQTQETVFVPSTVVEITSIPTNTLEETPIIIFRDITNIEANNKFLSIIENNGQCELPCVWGLSPGQTSKQDLDSFLNQLPKTNTLRFYIHNFLNENSGSIVYAYRKNSVISNFIFSYYVNNKNNNIDMLTLHAYGLKENGLSIDWDYIEAQSIYDAPEFNQMIDFYSLKNVLSRNGKPSKILIFVNDFPIENSNVPPRTVLLILYEEQGFLVVYTMLNEENDNLVVACPNKSTINLVAWDQEQNISMDDVIEKGGTELNHETYEYFKALDEVTPYSMDSFFKKFTSNNSSCIEINQ